MDKTRERVNRLLFDEQVAPEVFEVLYSLVTRIEDLEWKVGTQAVA